MGKRRQSISVNLLFVCSRAHVSLAVLMNEAEESRPTMDLQRGAMVAVRMASPQPMSSITSVGWGSRYWTTFVVRSGTKDAAAL